MIDPEHPDHRNLGSLSLWFLFLSRFDFGVILSHRAEPAARLSKTLLPPPSKSHKLICCTAGCRDELSCRSDATNRQRRLGGVLLLCAFAVSLSSGFAVILGVIPLHWSCIRSVRKRSYLVLSRERWFWRNLGFICNNSRPWNSPRNRDSYSCVVIPLSVVFALMVRSPSRYL